MRCCDDVMIMTNNLKKQHDITLQTKQNKMTLIASARTLRMFHGVSVEKSAQK